MAGRDPNVVIPEAIRSAEQDILAPAHALIDWCLPEITEQLGYLLPGSVTYGVAFPKNGKTGFLSNNLAYWDRTGVRVWVMPTESRPKGLVTRLACLRQGVSVDDAMSRRLRQRADAGDPVANEQLVALLREFDEMMRSHERDGANIAIEPAPRLTRRTFQQSIRAAVAGGYELVVVDHVDHIGGDEGQPGGYAASEAVQYDALEFAETHDIAILLMSQLNTSRVQNDPLHRFRRPISDWLWMKGVKDQIATTMFGIYRPMLPDISDALLHAVRTGEQEAWRVAIPNRMALALMLSRFSGARPDRTLQLAFTDGVLGSVPVVDNLALLADRHGIHTGSPSLRTPTRRGAA